MNARNQERRRRVYIAGWIIIAICWVCHAVSLRAAGVGDAGFASTITLGLVTCALGICVQIASKPQS